MHIAFLTVFLASYGLSLICVAGDRETSQTPKNDISKLSPDYHFAFAKPYFYNIQLFREIRKQL